MLSWNSDRETAWVSLRIADCGAHDGGFACFSRVPSATRICNFFAGPGFSFRSEHPRRFLKRWSSSCVRNADPGTVMESGGVRVHGSSNVQVLPTGRDLAASTKEVPISKLPV